jgi:hypothetical protein
MQKTGTITYGQIESATPVVLVRVTGTDSAGTLVSTQDLPPDTASFTVDLPAGTYSFTAHAFGAGDVAIGTAATGTLVVEAPPMVNVPVTITF